MPASTFFMRRSTAVLTAAVVTVLTACSASDDVTGLRGRGPSPAKQPAGGVTISALGVSPATVTGGTSTQGTVTLSGPASGKGTTISLVSSAPAASVPSSVTIPRGQTSATFTITTAPSWGEPVTITASDGRTTKSAQLTVAAPDLASLTLSPITISVNGASQGTVTLTGPAAGDLTVSLTSSDPAAATVSASVVVPAGRTSALFTVTGVSPAADVVITGTLGPTSHSARLTVQ